MSQTILLVNMTSLKTTDNCWQQNTDISNLFNSNYNCVC